MNTCIYLMIVHLISNLLQFITNLLHGLSQTSKRVETSKAIGPKPDPLNWTRPAALRWRALEDNMAINIWQHTVSLWSTLGMKALRYYNHDGVAPIKLTGGSDFLLVVDAGQLFFCSSCVYGRPLSGSHVLKFVHRCWVTVEYLFLHTFVGNVFGIDFVMVVRFKFDVFVHIIRRCP